MENKITGNIAKIATCIGIVVILLWIISGFIIDYYWGEDGRGTIGDMFGAVNALFSGLAFAGLIITLLYQKEELSLQRAELSQTRQELESQCKEFEQQNKTLKQQRFDNTFFNMLTLQQEIINNIRYVDNRRSYDFRNKQQINEKTTFEGRQVFGYFYGNHLRDAITEKGVDVYDRLNFVPTFDHYFRHLFHIVKFIDNSTLIDEVDKNEYASMLESQLSKNELRFLFYYGQSAKGKHQLKPLIEKYSLLRSCNGESLVNPEHVKLYDSRAFNIA